MLSLGDVAQNHSAAASKQCHAFFNLGDGPRGNAKCGSQRRQARLGIAEHCASRSARFPQSLGLKTWREAKMELAVGSQAVESG